jgi:hypothetical protein
MASVIRSRRAERPSLRGRERASSEHVPFVRIRGPALNNHFKAA